jgi:enamine deaminase RidA (YjgF/YER057c/UK114 family)
MKKQQARISGMTARRADGTIASVGDIEAQTRQVCENLKAAVEAAGGTMQREYFGSPPPAVIGG